MNQALPMLPPRNVATRTALVVAAIVALFITILATPALAAPQAPSPELRERVGTAAPVRAVVTPATPCSVRHTSFGPVRVCTSRHP